MEGFQTPQFFHSFPPSLTPPQSTRLGVIYEACSPSEQGAQEMTLQYFADNNLADKVLPPRITMRDFEKVLPRARPTVGKSDLEIFEKFTAEFGEEANY